MLFVLLNSQLNPFANDVHLKTQNLRSVRIEEKTLVRYT